MLPFGFWAGSQKGPVGLPAPASLICLCYCVVGPVKQKPYCPVPLPCLEQWICSFCAHSNLLGSVSKREISESNPNILILKLWVGGAQDPAHFPPSPGDLMQVL